MERVYDAVVVGAGYVGCSVAYHLTKSGLRTVLVEQGNGICSGASGGNYGCVQVQDAELKHSVPFVKAGFRYFDCLEDELGMSFRLRPRYSLLVIENENQWDKMKLRHEVIRQAGIQSELIPAERIPEIEPLFNHHTVLGALYHPYEAQVYPFDFAWAYVNRAQQMGLEFLTNTQVTGFELQGGRIAGVRIQDRVMSTGLVVLTTGAWTSQLGKTLGYDWEISYITGQACATEVTGEEMQGYVSSAAFFEDVQSDSDLSSVKCALAIAQSPHGNFLLGESSSVQAEFRRRVSYQGISAIVEQSTRYFPILERLNIIRSWAVPVAHTADQLPFLGAVSGVPGLFMAVAFHSTVITTPLVGNLIKQLVFGEETEVNIRAFSPDRCVVC
ncbi:MAG: FAD-binding oxidoreductase [Anaerolineae bacterium]|nr:FAD-binding oxidoreductase [Anaerolineae bacterium]